MTEVRKTLFENDRVSVRYTRRSADEHMGRFGGGWQWVVGVEANENFTSIILNLLVCMVRIERKNRERPPVVRQCKAILDGERCDLNAKPHTWHQHRRVNGDTLTWSDETPGARNVG